MQQFLTSIFGDNKIAQIGAMVAAALVLIVIVVLIVRIFFNGRVRAAGGRNRQPRLAIVDAFDLDRQRQLVLVRRDSVEHLVMIGGPNDVVIESGIIRGQMPTRDKDRGDKERGEGSSTQLTLPIVTDTRQQTHVEDDLHDKAQAELKHPVEALRSEPKMTPPAEPAKAPAPVANPPLVNSQPPLPPRAGSTVRVPPEVRRAPEPAKAAEIVASVAEVAPVAEMKPMEIAIPAPYQDSLEADMLEQLKAIVPKDPVDLPNPLNPAAAPPASAQQRSVTASAPQRSFSPLPPRAPSLQPRPNFAFRPLTQPKPFEPNRPVTLQPPEAAPAKPEAPKMEAAKPVETFHPAQSSWSSPEAPTAEMSPAALTSLHPLDELEEEMARLLGRPVKLD